MPQYHLNAALSDQEGLHLRVPGLLADVGALHPGHHAEWLLLHTPQLNVLVILRTFEA